MEFLLAHGAEVNASGVEGETLFYPLGDVLNQDYLGNSDKEDDEAAAILIRYGAHLQCADESALPQLAAKNKLQLVKAILEIPDVSVNAQHFFGRTAIQEAAEKGHVEMVRLLLTVPGHDLDMTDRKGDTAIRIAVGGGNTEIIRAILTCPNFNQQARRRAAEDALQACLANKDINLAKDLIAFAEMDMSMTVRGLPILCLAVSTGDVAFISYLLDKPEVNAAATDEFGRSALHWVTGLRSFYCDEVDDVDIFEIVCHLVKAGTPLDTVSRYGQTALGIAVLNGWAELATYLLELGAKPDAVVDASSPGLRWTILHEALSQREYDIWDMAGPDDWSDMVEAAVRNDPQILEVTSLVNSADDRQNRVVSFDGTALVFAVLYACNSDWIYILLDNGARVDVLATRRHVPIESSQYTILAAALCEKLPDTYPYHAATDIDILTNARDLENVEGLIETLFAYEARIDDPRDQQTVLEFALRARPARK